MADKKVKSGVETEGAEPSVSSKKSGDDNVIAALAHGLLLFVPVLAPLAIWLVYKDKSNYVKKQAMQALVFQIAGSAVITVLFVVFFVFAFATMGIGGLCFPVLFVPVLGWLGYGVFAAYKCFQGDDFEYAVIGKLIPKNV